MKIQYRWCHDAKEPPAKNFILYNLIKKINRETNNQQIHENEQTLTEQYTGDAKENCIESLMIHRIHLETS